MLHTCNPSTEEVGTGGLDLAVSDLQNFLYIAKGLHILVHCCSVHKGSEMEPKASSCRVENESGDYVHSRTLISCKEN